MNPTRYGLSRVHNTFLTRVCAQLKQSDQKPQLPSLPVDHQYGKRMSGLKWLCDSARIQFLWPENTRRLVDANDTRAINHRLSSRLSSTIRYHVAI